MDKVENEEDEKRVVPNEKHYGDFEPSPIPIAPDGGIMPGFALQRPSALPAATPETFVCLRGPCRHYWHLVTDIDAGNPDDTWDGSLTDPATGEPVKRPRQHNHTCLVNPGMETDLTGDHAYECNKWDPQLHAELVQLDTRRRTYYATHPATATPELEEEVPDVDDAT